MNRWLYWTDYDAKVPKIQRMSMDGTAKTILHNTNLSAPYSFTLDSASQTLYWADYNLNKIEKSSTNGSNRELVTTMVNDVYSITFHNGKLYWTDLTDDQIFTTPTTSPNPTIFSTTLGDMYGIKAVAREQQPRGCNFPLLAIYIYH